jgi:hypothetical protein
VQLRYVKGIVSPQALLNLRRSQGLQLLLDVCPPSVLLFIAFAFALALTLAHVTSIQLSSRGLPESPTQPRKRLALSIFA